MTISSSARKTMWLAAAAVIMVGLTVAIERGREVHDRILANVTIAHMEWIGERFDGEAMPSQPGAVADGARLNGWGKPIWIVQEQGEAGLHNTIVSFIGNAGEEMVKQGRCVDLVAFADFVLKDGSWIHLPEKNLQQRSGGAEEPRRGR